MLVPLLVGCSEYQFGSGETDAASDTEGVAETADSGGADTDDGSDTMGSSCPAVDPPVAAEPRTCLDPDGALTVDPVWTYSSGVYPRGAMGLSVGPLSDTDGDGLVTIADRPSVVFGSSGRVGESVVALSGVDGTELWQSTSGNLAAAAPPLLVDLDGDRAVEVLVMPSQAGDPPDRVVALEGSTGAEHWRSDALVLSENVHDALAAADLDGDGVAEVLDGPIAIDGAGAQLFHGAAGEGGMNPNGDLTVVDARQTYGVDLDGDGSPEVLAGASAYAADGSTAWDIDELGEGHSIAADFDGDGVVEILFVRYGNAWGLSASGEEVFGPLALEGDCEFGLGPGPVAAEDLDGDGLPEFVVACRTLIAAYSWDGSVLWSNPINDYSTAAGPAIADLDGDGVPEVAYGDQDNIFVFAGATGAVRWSAPRVSGTIVETPVFADIDLDGRVEMLVGSNGALTAYRASPAGPGRPIWNSHSYHITDINDDMTIPSVSEPYWLTTNSFRSAGLGDRLPDVDPYPVFLDVCELECDRDRVVISATVANGGGTVTPAGLDVVLRAGPDGPVLATATTSEDVAPYTTGEVLRFEVAATRLGGQPPTIEVDPAGRREQCLTRTDDDVAVWTGPVCE